jgi:hypothetical protein
VSASGAPPAFGDETPLPAGIDARSAARVIAEPSVRVIVGRAERAEALEAGSSTAFEVGALLDSRYRIVRFVGRGGMGEVYEAHDQLMDRQVALKTILHSIADRSRAARRFKAEVRNAQRVAHPHVCRIHDLHEHQDGSAAAPLPFFTMELIDGERLAQRLLGPALALEDTRRIALQLLDGLAAAHARGVLHLDFKSDNVMLRRGTSQPEAAIMDFGLSRANGDSGGLLTSDRRQFAGTLPYMSIEQLECRESLGPATDVYAFGVVLYEMLTRSLPFEGESLGTLLMKQLNERPQPPSRRVPGLAHAIDRFVLRCLDREPRERFTDAGAALAALSAIRTWSRPAAAFARWRALWPAAALFVAGGVLVSRRSAELPTSAAPAELAQVTSPLGAWPPASSRDPASALIVPAAGVAGATITPSLAGPSSSVARSAADDDARAGVRASATVAGVGPRAAAADVESDGVVTPVAVRAFAAPVQHRSAREARPAQSEAVPAASRPHDGTIPPSVRRQGTAPTAPAAAGAVPHAEAREAADTAPTWTPTRVPKRLSSVATRLDPTSGAAPRPAQDPSSPAPSGAQNLPR